MKSFNLNINFATNVRNLTLNMIKEHSAHLF